jgi:UDP-N-acetyl-D-glucosamine dehydrogenase
MASESFNMSRNSQEAKDNGNSTKFGMPQKQVSLSKFENVVVIGAGYVGFPEACAIAGNSRYRVAIFDIDKSKIEKINKKIPPVDDEWAESRFQKLDIRATDNEAVISGADFILICVPTPIDDEKQPDLTPVIKATESIARNLSYGQTIILESTVNPGVCEEVILPILEKTGFRGGIDFELAHSPERVNPGDKKWNVHNIPRNVGALTPKGAQKVAEFYQNFIEAKITVLSSIKAAEATKILENTFRDVNIALINEFAKFCDKMGIDLIEVLKGASTKPFAFMPHFPGCGVGGHCIPVDPYYLIKKAEENGLDHKLVRVAREVNNSMPHYTVKKLITALNREGKNIGGIKIGLLGLAYKANSNDMRESPSFEIREELVKSGATVLSYDPHIPSESDASLNKILKEAEAVIIAAAHDEFLNIGDWKNVRIIVDGRNCLQKENFELSDITYVGIGRGE